MRIHRVRDVAEDRVAKALAEERARNPLPDPGGRAMLVAIPLNGRRNLARDFVRGDQMRVIHLSRSAEQGLPASLHTVRTSPPHLTNYEIRAVGLAGTDLLGPGRTVGAADEGYYATDIEVSESGEIRILASGVVQHLGLPNGVARPAIFESVLIAWVHRLIAWTSTLSNEFGYTGAWGFGVTASGLEGKRSAHEEYNMMPTYDRDAFESVTIAGHVEIEDAPYLIAERLLGRFAAAVGSYERYRDAFEGAPLADPSDAM